VVGDRVRHRVLVGGPTMLVTAINAVPDMVTCVWFDKSDVYRTANFPLAMIGVAAAAAGVA